MATARTSTQGPQLQPAEPMGQMLPEASGARSRWIIPPRPEGWDGFVLSEWELNAAGFSDHHPHVEVNVVIEGELHVEANGVEIVAGVGDTVYTPAGAVGRYWAPEHARMIAIYGHNPEGLDTEYLEYWDIAVPPASEGHSTAADGPEDGKSAPLQELTRESLKSFDVGE